MRKEKHDEYLTLLQQTHFAASFCRVISKKLYILYLLTSAVRFAFFLTRPESFKVTKNRVYGQNVDDEFFDSLVRRVDPQLEKWANRQTGFLYPSLGAAGFSIQWPQQRGKLEWAQ